MAIARSSALTMAYDEFGVPRFDETREWHACYTLVHREKKVADLLRRRGIASFLPVVPRVRQWHDRKKTIEWPLFRSYVFASPEPFELRSLVETPGIAYLVRNHGSPQGRPAVLTQAEIQNIGRFAAALGRSGVEAPIVEYQAGDRVRIMSGPFAGVEGVVVEQGRRRVLVGLRTIGAGFAVDVDGAALQRVR